ncbi:MAG: complex I subunit 4 family protein [Fimbriimonadaceae bacterium]
MGILSLVTFAPLIGALLISLVPAEHVKAIKALAMVTAIATLGLSVLMYLQFQAADFHFQLMESVPWIPSLGIRYELGVDGISLWMVLMTAVLGVVATGVSVYETKRAKAFMILLLLLETTMLGTFVAVDMILFYTFFEAALLPIALLIWVWGDERRKKAAVRVFIYLFAGSIFMLVGMIVLAHLTQSATGRLSFSLIDVQAAVAHGSLWAGALNLEAWVFWAFALAFLIKSPVFPFHTWLVDSYTQAPTGAVILGVLVKTGTYGLLRFCLTLFPDTLPHAAPLIMSLALIGILYGGAAAAVQVDIKRLIAFSSLAHVGFIVLGAFSMSYNGLLGATLGGVNHGIATGAIFLLIGFLYLRRKSRGINEFGGLKAQMPVFSALFLVATLAALGLPGTNAFVGEFLALLGTFESGLAHIAGLSVVYAVLAAAGVILAAVYMLILFQRLFYGEPRLPAIRRLKDLKPWEVALALVPTALILWGGAYPSTFTHPMEASVNATRMMGMNPASSRPAWSEQSESLDAGLNLQSGSPGATAPISAAGLHPVGSIAAFNAATRVDNLERSK